MQKVQVVSWSLQQNIALIVIDNPPVNVLSADVIEQLNIVVDEIERDPNVKVVVLTGAGEKAFVAGGDIKGFPEWIGKGVEEAKQKSLWLQEPLNKIERLPHPTIAAINGLALGGGCELALSCDIRVAEEHVQIGLPEVKLGLFPGAGGTQRLPRLIGKARAKEMIFTGESISAEEAERIGLVNHVVPKGTSLEKAMEIANKINKHSSLPITFAKSSIDVGYEQPLDESLVTEATYFGHAFQTKDVQEGVEAFIQKRKANFTNN
ncbi:enoyl-CoA hydratase/isomerase family protein [Psychrobacillus sp. NPDC096426]|uniref:enoyl-CoA hydratase/isomerase family protein n=1 Tax=Psychrobacillus sp. NPDC096426 TaxID=3364491 RepID=UPI0038266D67